jgi:hypothetical protein
MGASILQTKNVFGSTVTEAQGTTTAVKRGIVRSIFNILDAQTLVLLCDVTEWVQCPFAVFDWIGHIIVLL